MAAGHLACPQTRRRPWVVPLGTQNQAPNDTLPTAAQALGGLALASPLWSGVFPPQPARARMHTRLGIVFMVLSNRGRCTVRARSDGKSANLQVAGQAEFCIPRACADLSAVFQRSNITRMLRASADLRAESKGSAAQLWLTCAGSAQVFGAELFSAC
jgi:hypothetical protein